MKCNPLYKVAYITYNNEDFKGYYFCYTLRSARYVAKLYQSMKHLSKIRIINTKTNKEVKII